MTIYCPVNPKDFIDAPYGAFLKEVRKYDPDYGWKQNKNYLFTIEYEETRTDVLKHRVVVKAHTFEEAKQKIIDSPTQLQNNWSSESEYDILVDEVIDEDGYYDCSEFQEIGREEA